MRRPNSDFKKSNRAIGNLKSGLPTFRPCKSDIDNLSKFVMDSLCGIAYMDDRQVTKLIATKEMDNQGLCEGRTYIEWSKLSQNTTPNGVK